jgi:cytochrome c5
VSGEKDNVFLLNFAKVIAGLTGVTVLLIVLVNSIFGGEDPEREALAKERAEKNLAPEYAVRLSGEPAPALASAEAPADSGEVMEVRSGEQVTQAVCIACHQGGYLNAPAIGDVEGWSARVGKGWETLTGNVVNGYGNMPAQGGAASEEEIVAAIEWMIESETGVDIPES